MFLESSGLKRKKKKEAHWLWTSNHNYKLGNGIATFRDLEWELEEKKNNCEQRSLFPDKMYKMSTFYGEMNGNKCYLSFIYLNSV